MTELTADTADVLDGPSPLAEGETVVSGYEVVGHLHRSGGFDVYDVFSEERRCRCVAKVPRPDRGEDRELVRGLAREGRLLGDLTHPHIVRVYEVLGGATPALILETLTGETLAHLIDTSRRRLPLSDIAHLGLHLCSAVGYLHRRGVLHLDLKPSNIVSERGLAKILDLSIARPPGRGRKGVGTPQYMAPEQARGEVLGPTTDAWGIGAVLFEATTGEMPFGGAATDEDPERYERLERRAAPIREHRRVPADLARAIDRCLRPSPRDRHTVDGLAQALATFVDQTN